MKKLKIVVEHYTKQDEEFIARVVHDYRFSAYTLTYWKSFVPPNRWSIDICGLNDQGVENTKKRLLELEPTQNVSYEAS